MNESFMGKWITTYYDSNKLILDKDERARAQCCQTAVDEVLGVLTEKYARYTNKRDLVNTLVSQSKMKQSYDKWIQSILAFNPEDQDLLARNLARATSGLSKACMDSPCTDCLGGRSMGQIMHDFNNKHKRKNQDGQQTGGRRGRGGNRGNRGRDNQNGDGNGDSGNGQGRRGRGRNQNDRGGRGGQQQGQTRDNNKSGKKSEL